jgi:hypothetical protein
MARRPNRRPPLLAARGGVSWVTLLLVASVVLGVYLAWVWGPVYVVHYEVQQVVRDYMNQAVKNQNDAELVEKMCQKIRSLAKVEQVSDEGRVERVPAVPLYPQDVTWERDVTPSQRNLHVSFEYVRLVEYPYLGRVAEKTFAVELDNDLDIPDWGPQR